MSLDNEIAKASELMWKYKVAKSDQIAIIKMLVDAGVEKCLDEQQRIRDEQDSQTLKAYAGLVH